MKNINCEHNTMSEAGVCITCAEINARWGEIGCDLPLNFGKVYLSENVVKFENLENDEVIEEPEVKEEEEITTEE